MRRLGLHQGSCLRGRAGRPEFRDQPPELISLRGHFAHQCGRRVEEVGVHGLAFMPESSLAVLPEVAFLRRRADIQPSPDHRVPLPWSGPTFQREVDSAVNADYVPFFHVGTLVRDIDQAAADFARILGLRFEPVRSAPLVSGEMMRFCYSLQGPPYLELVQMAETSIGLWGPEQGEGL